MQCRRTIDAGRRGFVTQSTFAMLTAGLGLGAGVPAGVAGPRAGAAGPRAGAAGPRAGAAGPRAGAAGAHAGPAGPLARAAAASRGLNSRGLHSFLDAVAAGSFELYSLVVARHGHIVAGGWYAPVRFAVAAGNLPPTISANLAALNVIARS